MDSDERALEVMKTKLDVLLAEYASVREEKVGRIQLQTTLSQAMLTGLVAVYGAMIQTDQWQAIPLIGFFSAMVALFWGERQRVIQLLRDYIREELESKRLEQILGPYDLPIPCSDGRHIFIGSGISPLQRSISRCTCCCLALVSYRR